MAHWNRLFGDRILTMRYEDMVAEPESQSKTLADFLEIDWTPEMLEFHQDERPVQTASLMQVRKEIYTSAVEKWRAYEDYLEPLKMALAV